MFWKKKNPKFKVGDVVYVKHLNDYGFVKKYDERFIEYGGGMWYVIETEVESHTLLFTVTGKGIKKTSKKEQCKFWLYKFKNA